jgi:hypothetical protein
LKKEKGVFFGFFLSITNTVKPKEGWNTVSAFSKDESKCSAFFAQHNITIMFVFSQNTIFIADLRLAGAIILMAQNASSHLTHTKIRLHAFFVKHASGFYLLCLNLMIRPKVSFII